MRKTDTKYLASILNTSQEGFKAFNKTNESLKKLLEALKLIYKTMKEEE